MKRTAAAVLVFIGAFFGGLAVRPTSMIQASRPADHGRQSEHFEMDNANVKNSSPGTRLNLAPTCIDEDGSPLSKMHSLPSGEVLLGICDTLFLLDSHRRVKWQYIVPQVLVDFSFIPSTGLVYGTAGDNNMFILDASSGKELVRNSRNGAVAYGQVVPYEGDMCLILDDNSGYRERLKDESVEDGLTAWKGTEAVWNTELPPGAQLIITGAKILALTNNKEGVFIKEISVPEHYGP
jgi:hypothetical protein